MVTGRTQGAVLIPVSMATVREAGQKPCAAPRRDNLPARADGGSGQKQAAIHSVSGAPSRNREFGVGGNIDRA